MIENNAACMISAQIGGINRASPIKAMEKDPHTRTHTQYACACHIYTRDSFQYTYRRLSQNNI